MKEECLFHALRTCLSHHLVLMTWRHLNSILGWKPCSSVLTIMRHQTRMATRNVWYKSPKANISLNVHLSWSNISDTSIDPLMGEINITKLVTCIDSNQDTLEWSNDPSSQIETDTTSFICGPNHDCLWQVQSLPHGSLANHSPCWFVYSTESLNQFDSDVFLCLLRTILFLYFSWISSACMFLCE